MSATNGFRMTLLTPPGRGAVATIAVWGPGCDSAVNACFFRLSGRTVTDEPLGQILFGHWGSVTGEELVIVRRAVDGIEIHCHGGAAAASAIQADLARHGAISASIDDWHRAQGVNPLELAVHRALDQATTLRTAGLLLDQLQGALRRAFERLTVDIEQGNVDGAQQRVTQLLARAGIGVHLTTPYRVVIAGPPNVGKSQLLNALLGFERAIVFDQPGTTRDLVRGLTSFDGWPIELIDTAGLHESSDPLENLGMGLSRRQMRGADLVVWVFDVTQPWNADHDALIAPVPRHLLVHNKSDLRAHPGARPAGLAISALAAVGLDRLMEQIVSTLVPDAPLAGEAVPFTSAQIAALQEVRERLDMNEFAAAGKVIRALLD